MILENIGIFVKSIVVFPYYSQLTQKLSVT